MHLKSNTEYEIEMRASGFSLPKYKRKIFGDTCVHSPSVTICTAMYSLFNCKWSANHLSSHTFINQHNKYEIVTKSGEQSARLLNGITKGMVVKLCLDLEWYGSGNFVGVISGKSNSFACLKTAYNSTMEGGLLDAFGIDKYVNTIYMGNDQRYVTSGDWTKPQIRSSVSGEEFFMIVDFDRFENYAVLGFYLDGKLMGGEDDCALGYTMKLPKDIIVWYPACSLYAQGRCLISTLLQ